MSNIGIIGCGIVGHATALGLARGHKLLTYDKFKSSPNTLQEIAENCEVIFLTVPTPMKKSGEIDLSAIYESVGILDEYCGNSYKENTEKQIIVIRSTAVSETTDKLAEKYKYFDFAFNPEFLTDKNANIDFINSKRIIIGANSDRVFEVLKKVYEDAQFTCPIIKTDVITAEYIKYCSNVFLAAQVSVSNELYEIAQLLKVNWEEIRKALNSDDRIGKFTKVPGEDNERGFSGKCFPKDLNALIYLAREHGYRPDLLEEIWRTNLKFRKNQDW